MQQVYVTSGALHFTIVDKGRDQCSVFLPGAQLGDRNFWKSLS
jgi:hypothetical protein